MQILLASLLETCVDPQKSVETSSSMPLRLLDFVQAWTEDARRPRSDFGIFMTFATCCMQMAAAIHLKLCRLCGFSVAGLNFSAFSSSTAIAKQAMARSNASFPPPAWFRIWETISCTRFEYSTFISIEADREETKFLTIPH
jgi:hypothetical protein